MICRWSKYPSYRRWKRKVFGSMFYSALADAAPVLMRVRRAGDNQSLGNMKLLKMGIRRGQAWVARGLSAAFLAAGMARGQVPPPPQAIQNGPAPVDSAARDRRSEWQRSFRNSVAGGNRTLSLRDAIQRGLKYNLGVLTNSG